MYTEKFKEIINIVITYEQGLVENKNDDGGITNMGISLRFLKNVPRETLKKCGFICEIITKDDIVNLTYDQAASLYYYEFWVKSRFEDINNFSICRYVFDCAINMGISPAIKILQRAICASYKNRITAEDGILGDNTLHRVNNIFAMQNILIALRSERAGYYRSIVVKQTENEVFLEGWLNRAYCN